MDTVMQHENEVGRVVLVGRRTMTAPSAASLRFTSSAAHGRCIRMAWANSGYGWAKRTQLPWRGRSWRLPSEDPPAAPAPGGTRFPGRSPDLGCSRGWRYAGYPTAGVARFKGRYYDAGRRVTCFPPGVFDALIEAELLALAAPDPDRPALHRLVLIGDGHARFALCVQATGPKSRTTEPVDSPRGNRRGTPSQPRPCVATGLTTGTGSSQWFLQYALRSRPCVATGATTTCAAS